MNWEITGRNTISVPPVQKRIRDYKNLRPYFYADYFPLTESLNNTGDDVWLAYQLNRPKENDGIILAFRRKNCPDESITVKLRGLDQTADYELIDEDTGKKIIQKGEALTNGIKLSLAEKDKSLQILYKKVE